MSHITGHTVPRPVDAGVDAVHSRAVAGSRTGPRGLDHGSTREPFSGTAPTTERRSRPNCLAEAKP